MTLFIPAESEWYRLHDLTEIEKQWILKTVDVKKLVLEFDL